MILKRILAAALACAILLAGCGKAGSDTNSPSPQPEPESAAVADEDPEAIQRRLVQENAGLLGGLTEEQILEDYEYLWAVLRDSFPFFGVMERRGIDVDAVYQKYRAELPAAEGDVDMIFRYNDLVAELQYTAHLGLISGASTYDYMRMVYGELAGDAPHVVPLLAVLEDPVVKAAYTKMAEYEAKAIEAQGGGAAADQPAAQPEDAEAQAVADTEIAEARLLENGVPYVRIAGFGEESQESDRGKLLAFFQENAEASNLIIDLRGNGGGSDYYWQKNIAGLLLPEAVTFRQYSLFSAKSEYSRAYLEAMEDYASARPLSELPKLPALNQDDLAQLDSFMTTEALIEPAEDGIRYRGRIWALVDDSIYSSSETFAMFCADTGFATLVGTTTSGDGGGTDPLLVFLPNSGLVFRLSNLYTINADGSNSEESGTTPDVAVPQGAEALAACLEAMA